MKSKLMKKSQSSETNDCPKLSLLIDFHNDCLAGTFVTGRVYLVLPAPTARWLGIHVRLEGYEHATTTIQIPIPPEANEHATTTAEIPVRPEGKERANTAIADKGTLMQTLTQTTTSPLIHTEQPIVVWKAGNHPDLQVDSVQVDSAQRFEFPFRWRLPSNLPSSMYCQKGKTTDHYCRIEYKMTAFLVSRLGEKLHPSPAVPLSVRSQTFKGQPLTVPVEKFSIKRALVFRQGHIEFGLKLSTDTISPGSTLGVGVYGSNRSQVAVKDFVIRLVERVSWFTQETSPSAQLLSHNEGTVDSNKDGNTTSQTVERTLAKERIWTADTKTDWQPSKSKAGRHLQDNETLWIMLQVPKEGDACRSSLAGECISVEHFLVVIAETSTDYTTNPRRSHPVRLMNANLEDLITTQVLVWPSDREPVVAPVMEIQDNQIVPQTHDQATVARED